jgi:hypothetical protein
VTKTRAAFELTAERLFDGGCDVYFWTFTFVVLHSDWEASALFGRFLWELRRTLGGDWGGVRVVELHKEHGVHYHALINRRLAIDIVRRVGRLYGLGRIGVKKADVGAARYLSKYLSKQRKGPLTESGRNTRRWASFGGVPHTRISDLVNDSPMWVYRREHKLPFLGYKWEAYLQQAWLRGVPSFVSCWFAAKTGRLGDVLGIVHGQLEARGQGELVERLKPEVMADCPF